MSVRAVTPYVVALKGHLAFRDLDHHDAANDERVTGDIFDPEWPDKPLRLKPTPGSHVRPTRERRGRSPMNEVADHRVGLDGRSATSTSFPSVGARGGAGEQAASLGGGPASSSLDLPRAFRSPSSRTRAGAEPNRQDESQPGGNRAGS